MKNAVRPLLYIVGIAILAVAYQNCGDISINQLDQNSGASLQCFDLNKELTLLETGNTSQNQTEIKSFQLFEVSEDGLNLRPFVPEDARTTWPPSWSVNGATQSREVVFRTELPLEECRESRVRAEFNVCGQDSFYREISFMSGNCQPIRCTAYGQTAQVGETLTFFNRDQGTCTESCASIQRTCMANGQFGPALGDAQIDVTQYQRMNCTPPAAGSCTQTPAPPAVACPSNNSLINPAGFGNSGKTWNNWAFHYRGTDSRGNPVLAPDISSATRKILLSPSQTLSLPFRLNSALNSQLALTPISNCAWPSCAQEVIVTISECPNDFRKNQNDPMYSAAQKLPQNCYYDSLPNEQSSLLAVHKDAAAGGQCALDPAKTYYLNILLGSPQNFLGVGAGYTSSCEMDPEDGNGLCGFGFSFGSSGILVIK